MAVQMILLWREQTNLMEDKGSVREEEQPLECIGYSTVMKEKLYSYTILLSV